MKKNKALFEEDKNQSALKLLPTPKDDCGSLKTAFRGKTAKQLLDYARKEEKAKNNKNMPTTKSAQKIQSFTFRKQSSIDDFLKTSK